MSYFIMVTTSITEMVMYWAYPIPTRDLGCLKTGHFGSAIAHLPEWLILTLDIILEYWVEHVTIGLFNVKFIF